MPSGSSPLDRLRHHCSGATQRGEAEPAICIKPGSTLSIDFCGWHIWQNTQGRIICNGPTQHNKLFDFGTADEAINWLYISGYKDVARRLHAEVKQRNALKRG